MTNQENSGEKLENQETGNQSLLESVLQEQQEERRQQFKPQELLAVLFEILSEQEKEILKRRYALDAAEAVRKQTLEEIGKVYRVTRERIRQIENRAINKIKTDNRFEAVVSPIESVVFDTLERYGGIMEENFLIDQLLTVNGAEKIFESDRRATIFLVSKLLGRNLERIESDEHFLPGWKLKLSDLDFLRNLVLELNSFMSNHGRPITLEELIRNFRAQSKTEPEKLSLNLIESALELAANLKSNPFGEWGLTSWRTIVPKRMADKIYLILQKAGKPLHFVEITELINQQNFDRKKANPATVHNELIMSDKYILIGRGVYALQEWGYKPGVVTDIISDAIKEKGPLTRGEIVDLVLKQRIVKPGTVALALSDKTKFKKMEDGRYDVVRN